jgi:VWFA-related protein
MSRSELVVLHVAVKDRRGEYVRGLTREAFQVIDNGRPRTVDVFAAEDAPATIGLLIDGSMSMQRKRDWVIGAVASFAEAGHPDDELFALAFNEHVRSVLPHTAPFTSDRALLRTALFGSVRARGRTALYDALIAGLDHVGKGRHDRNVLVLVSDGEDNASTASLADVVAKAQASNATIYTVALMDEEDRRGTPRVLRELAELTGGEAFAPDDVRDIGRVLTQIARDIQHTYTLGYTPDGETRDGRLHQLRVVVDGPDDRRLVVRTRRAYLAGQEPRQP